MISTLFSQFRHQYANGSLTTELLMTHAEQYLVKATVTIGEQIIATALAADTSLVAADDQAKTRALAMLGFGQTESSQPSAAVADMPSESIDEVAESNPVAAPLAPPAPAVPAPPPSPEVVAHAETAEADDIGRPIDSITPDEAPAPAEVPASSLAAAAMESFDDTNPVDLSDVIAQTDVEMARLGWSSSQGRQYLEQTFNKRSRQQLTDEELLTFLLYLESQATPSMS